MTYQNFFYKPSLSGMKSRTARKNSPTRLRRSARRRGQALLEMAFVVIVLLFLTLGLIQYGLIANAKVTMANIAREGARYAAVKGTESTSDDPSTEEGNSQEGSIRDRVRNVAATTTLSDITDDNILISPPVGSRTRGDLVTVTITYDMKRKFILSSSFPGLDRFGGLTQTSATMVLE